MQIFLAIIDLLKAIAWPLAVIVISVIFKDSFSELLKRVRKIGPTGAEMSDVVAQARQEGYAVPKSIDDLKNLKNFPSTDAMDEVRFKLHQSIGEINEADRIDILINQLSLARLDLLSATAYQFMFGSQEAFLRGLAISPVSTESAEQFFESVKNMHPDLLNDWTLAKWAAHLIRNKLMILEGNAYHITKEGRHFLTFLNRSGLAGTKVL